MPRICAALVLAGIAIAALRPRRRFTARADVQVLAERLTLLFGDMPSKAIH
ncbi:MAG: hypothetical protein MIL41_28255 [Hyphomicrobiales bacterium]|jgi:hypothetical protein